ncbi:LysE family transporter [Bradyrhizobium sp. ma5]|uniref:LysE family transporter n=1 Tax=Bradyrhizobium sp. ma5 TaxID=3344828 RepID=UPI0035D4FA44
MSAYVIELVTLMTIFSLVIVSPGADLAMVLRQSMVHGRRAAIVTSFGLGVSLLFHISYTILGLGAIISKSVALFNIVKWCGAAYLVYIGIKALRAGALTVEKTPPQDRTLALSQKPVAEQGLIKAFVLGFATNALNPKPVFFFLSIFATVVSVHTPAMVRFGYGLVMASCLILWFVGVSYFMTTPRMRAAFSRVSKWIDRVSGVVFIGLGLKLVTEKAG